MTPILEKALDDLARENYERGMNEGLAVAEKIANRLTLQPVGKKQAMIRDWAMTIIMQARLKP